MKIQYIRKLTASYMVLVQCEELQEWEKKDDCSCPEGEYCVCGMCAGERRKVSVV